MARTHEEREKALKVAESKNVVEVAQSLGMDLVKSGRNYTWSEHDSFVFNTRKNLFYWNSRQKGGGAIQLVQIIKGCNYGEAVKYLNNVDVGTFEEVEIEKKEPFKYFMKEHTKMSATMDYLIGERKLSKDTVDFFISKGILAQSTWKDKESGKTEPVIVFKHTDLEGNIRGVSLQGIWENKEMHGSRGRLKKTFGDGFYGMNVRVGNPPSVREATSEKPIKIIAFESPIDLMSYYELHKSSIGDAILLSMNGLRKGTISTYVVNELGLKVDENKKSTMLDVMNNLYQPIDIIQIVLAVDNDEFNPKLGFKPGQNFVDTFDVDFIPVKSGIPELLPGKKKSDWNDHVVEKKADIQQIKENDDVKLKSDDQSLNVNEVPKKTRLDLAKQKLARLEDEFEARSNAAFDHLAQTNGQPMNDKRGGASFFRRQDKKEDAVFNKLDEIKEQQKRIKKLEYDQETKELGLNKQGGLIMSVENIPRIKEEIERANKGESPYSVATIRKYKKKLIELEDLKEQSEIAIQNISDHARSLIESKEVTVWAKNPTIYFVKGLRKVALELTPEGEFKPSEKYAAKTEEESEKVSKLLKVIEKNKHKESSEVSEVKEITNRAFKGNDNLLKNYYSDSKMEISQGYEKFMPDTTDENYKKDMWELLNSNFAIYEQEMENRGLLLETDPKNLHWYSLDIRPVSIGTHPETITDQAVVDLEYTNAAGRPYGAVAYTRELTKDEIDEYDLTYLGVGETAEKATLKAIDFGGDTLSNEQTTIEEVKQLDHYFQIKFNERGRKIPNFAGQIITEEVLEKIIVLDAKETGNLGYYKFDIEEIRQGEVVSNIRLDVGDGVSSNESIYDRLIEVVEENKLFLQQEVPEDIIYDKEKQESSTVSKIEDSKVTEEVISVEKTEEKKTTILVDKSDYAKNLLEAIDESIDKMEEKGDPNHYITEEQLREILNDHLSKVDQLINHMQTSYNLLAEPTKAEATQLKEGMIETTNVATTEVKRSLSDALAETKQLAISNIKERASELRRFVKNSFNKPILALNSKIRGFVETIDRKFALETAEGKVELGSEETEIVPEQIENEPQQQSSVLIKEVQEYIALNAAKESLLAQIQKEIQDNPLAKIDTLQRTLEENQLAIKNVEQRIEAVTPSMISQQDQEAKEETLSELSNLVKERERLEAERNQIVQEPDFLRKEGSLDSFKLVDQQLNDVNERLMRMEEETQKSQEKESKIEPVVVGAAVADQVVKNKENQNDTLKSALTSQDTAAINSQLKSNMAEYFDPKNVKTYLDSASKFHNYSPKNVQLIMEQDPKATQVANENKWNQLGYELREDAKPIQVYQPVFVPIRDEEGRVKFKENNQPETEVEFQLKPVFDVSQTTAGHLKAPTQYDLTKDDQFVTVYKTIEDMSDAKVELQPLGNLNSHYDSKNRTVIVNEGLGKKETIQALLNEVLPLYNAENEKVKNANTLNVFEQEAAAYMIASHVGLDTSGFTFASLSQLKEEGYSLEDFTRSLTDSSKNATEIINSIDKNYEKSKKTSKTKNKFDERLSQANTKNKETMEQFQLKDQSVEKSASLRR